MRRLVSALALTSVLVFTIANCGDDDAALLPATTSASGGAGGTAGVGGSAGDENCTSDADCADAGDVCEQGVCIPEHCLDGELSSAESDVDCGGPCLPCADGKLCGGGLDCASGFCDEGSCAACSELADCADVPGTFCDTGVCTVQKELGEVCIGGEECASGFCPVDDGVCCDQRCDSACEACATDKTGLDDGSCGPVLVDTDPDAECGDEGASSCGANGTGCNGDAIAPGCNLYDSTTECAALSCSNGELTAARMCDGAGTCAMATPQACAPYICNDTNDDCLTSCTDDNDCDGSSYCSNNSCVARKNGGDGCTRGGECQSGFCPGDDGVCCDTACSGTCEACLASKTGGSNGVCSFVSQGQDPDNECTSLQTCNGNGVCTL